MKRSWFFLVLALALFPAAAAADQPAPVCSAQDGPSGEPSLTLALFTPQPTPAGNCPLYRRCICQCKQAGICCRNECQSQPNVSSCTNQCNEDEHACEDVCIARFVSDGTICDNVTCSLDPFCGAR